MRRSCASVRHFAAKNVFVITWKGTFATRSRPLIVDRRASSKYGSFAEGPVPAPIDRSLGIFVSRAIVLRVDRIVDLIDNEPRDDDVAIEKKIVLYSIVSGD